MGEASSTLAAVLADQSFASEVRALWSGLPNVLVGADEPLAQSLERLLAQRPHFVIVHGDDRLVSRALTAYHTQLRHKGYPLRLMPLAVGELQFVSRAIDEDLSPRRVARVLHEHRASEDFASRMLSCLKISSSMEAAAQYGFSFGAGWLFAAFEAYHRSGRSGRTNLAATAAHLTRDWVRSGEVPGRQGSAARVSVDYKSRSDASGYVLASTLEQSWFGTSTVRTDGPALVLGESALELVKRAALPRAVQRVRPKVQQSEAFERVHLDGFPGFVLDGELYEPAHANVVQVAAGPRVHFVCPPGGGLSRLVRALKG
ncbi:MAG: hypothetical protein H0U74_16300 [Bradymonadaceae bacterium]|nr:hypothetical protein [Lujinxingiaceae bacterium]